MANIVRCELPTGICRFKPFTVSDYRDFLLVRNDMNNKSEEEQKILIDELIADYFGEYPYAFRSYIFLKVFLASIGKTKIPIKVKCPVCEKYKHYQFNLAQSKLEYPIIESAGLKIKFKFPDKDYGKDMGKLVLDNILEVSDENGTYNWNELDDDTQVSVIDALDIESLDNLIKKMNIIYFELKTTCCNKNTLVYNNIVDIFKLLIHPDEVFTFYQINHRIVDKGYDWNSIMNMMPVERSITLSLIEKDISK